MGSEFNQPDFVDRDFIGEGEGAEEGGASAESSVRSVSPHELDSRVGRTHQELARLRQAQEQLEREQIVLEEAKRRRHEWEVGRVEMLDALVRGIGILERAEFQAMRDAEQMGKSLVDLRDRLMELEGINDRQWAAESWTRDLAQALTVVENARMEWNRARLKWPVLEEDSVERSVGASLSGSQGMVRSFWEEWDQRSVWDRCMLGLTLTWPVASLLLIAVMGLLILLSKR